MTRLKRAQAGDCDENLFKGFPNTLPSGPSNEANSKVWSRWLPERSIVI